MDYRPQWASKLIDEGYTSILSEDGTVVTILLPIISYDMKLNKGRGKFIVHNQGEYLKNEKLFTNYLQYYYQPGFRPPRSVVSSKGSLRKKKKSTRRSRR